MGTGHKILHLIHSIALNKYFSSSSTPAAGGIVNEFLLYASICKRTRGTRSEGRGGVGHEVVRGTHTHMHACV